MSTGEFMFPFLIIFFILHQSSSPGIDTAFGILDSVHELGGLQKYHQEFSYFSVSPSFISSFPSFSLSPSSVHPFLLSYDPFPLPSLLLTSPVCSLFHVQLIPAVFPTFSLPFCFLHNLLSLRRASDTAQWHIPLCPVLNINIRSPVQST